MRLIDADNLKAELFDANWLTDNDEPFITGETSDGYHKTPEEIKKGLECCARASEEACKHCPYCNDCDIFEACNLYRDALAYITQLEDRGPKWIRRYKR